MGARIMGVALFWAILGAPAQAQRLIGKSLCGEDPDQALVLLGQPAMDRIADDDGVLWADAWEWGRSVDDLDSYWWPSGTVQMFETLSPRNEALAYSVDERPVAEALEVDPPRGPCGGGGVLGRTLLRSGVLRDLPLL